MNTNLNEAGDRSLELGVGMPNDRLRIISAHVIEGLKQIAAGSVQCVVTSPPYWGLRSYLPKGHALKHLEIGQEKTPTDFVNTMLAVFGGKENPIGIWRVLREDGTVWLNLGDSYASTWSCSRVNAVGQGACDIGDRKIRTGNGIKEKDLIGIPWRVALALQAAGWYLRSDIVWAKPNCMPESVTDRPTRSHEYIFLLSKNSKYFYDAEAIKEPSSLDSPPLLDWETRKQMGEPMRAGTSHLDRPMTKKRNDKQRGHSRRHDGFNDRWDAMEKEEQCTGMRNKRDVWTVSPANYPEAHFATFPPELIKPCILAGTSAGGACAECGAPMRRQIEVGSSNLEHQKACGGDANGEYDGQSTKGHAANGVQDASAVKARILEGLRERKTVGWERTCKCKTDAAARASLPCLVLDPFGGSGTTGEVALELGRRAILIELNPNYLPLIEQRTNITPGFTM